MEIFSGLIFAWQCLRYEQVMVTVTFKKLLFFEALKYDCTI